MPYIHPIGPNISIEIGYLIANKCDMHQHTVYYLSVELWEEFICVLICFLLDFICFITECLENDLIEATCGVEAPDGNHLCPDIGAVAGD